MHCPSLQALVGPPPPLTLLERKRPALIGRLGVGGCMQGRRFATNREQLGFVRALGLVLGFICSKVREG